MAHGKTAEKTLEEIQHLVDQLTKDAWQEFFDLGAALAEADPPATETLTSAVLRMRR